MKTISMILFGITMSFFLGCQDSKNNPLKPLEYTNLLNTTTSVKRGAYLVDIMDCTTCHTPNNMTEKGPVPDANRLLSGYPADRPIPTLDKNIAATGVLFYHPDLTSSAGPWGISFAGNLTPDETGIGTWSLKQFTVAMQQGKHKGLEEGRNLLPPMPWQAYKNLTKDDIEAIFNYLNTITPVKNVVPAPVALNRK